MARVLVRPAQLLRHRGDSGFYLVVLADVSTHREGPAARGGDGLHRGTARAGVQVEHGDRHPVRR
jgi:hypothetical protein